MEIIKVLDKKGNYKGYKKDRQDNLNDDEYVKVIHLWIKIDEDKYLVHQRCKFKKVDPFVWSTVAGYVLNEENTMETLKRELKEEIGVDTIDSEFKLLDTLFPYGENKAIADVYLLEKNINIDTCVLQKEEVMDISVFSKEEIETAITIGMFNNFDNMYKDYYKKILKQI